MSRPDFRAQLDILVDRNFAVHAGSLGAASLMLLQAPLIGGFIGLAWKGEEAVPATYFVMAVASLWMGCMNACTAVVQERAVFERERLFDLDVRAYLLSKLAVLSVVGAAQTLGLLAVQASLMHLKESASAAVLGSLIMILSNVASAGLGLLISSFARTTYGAVVTVPILIIPQVLFSRLILQGNIDKSLPGVVEKLTITKWTYDSLSNLSAGAEWGVQLKCFAALALGLALFLAAAHLKLTRDTA